MFNFFKRRTKLVVNPDDYGWEKIEGYPHIYRKGVVTAYLEKRVDGQHGIVEIVATGDKMAFRHLGDIDRQYFETADYYASRLTNDYPDSDEGSWYGRTQACVHPTEGIGPEEAELIRENYNLNNLRK